MIYIMREEDIQIDLPLQSLYFYSPQMPFHQKFITMINAQEKDLPFTAIDIEQFRNQCKRFMITSVPTILVLKSGKEVKRLTGLVPTRVFRSAFADICNS